MNSEKRNVLVFAPQVWFEICKQCYVNLVYYYIMRRITFIQFIAFMIRIIDIITI